MIYHQLLEQQAGPFQTFVIPSAVEGPLILASEARNAQWRYTIQPLLWYSM
jgi:hypothetical protein